MEYCFFAQVIKDIMASISLSPRSFTLREASYHVVKPKWWETEASCQQSYESSLQMTGALAKILTATSEDKLPGKAAPKFLIHN